MKAGGEMRTFLLGLGLAAIAAATSASAQTASGVLLKQTQAMMDAVSAGDAKVWQLYLDDQARITDENGDVSDKKAMVAQVTPLPKGISGTIRIADWHLTLAGDTAIATHIDDEHENFHGQKLHALYRATDAWIKRPAGWRMIASQTLALRQDPPAVTLPSRLLDSSVGRYAIAPDYIYTIARNAGGLTGQTNGGKPQVLKAELADVLFVPGQPRTRKIFVRDANGQVTGFVSRREERDVVWKKIR